MRNSILNGANKDLIHSLCECIYNILRGNVELTESDKTQLIKCKNSLRKFLTKNSIKEKKKILIQKGGFLQILLPAVISGLARICQVQSKKNEIHKKWMVIPFNSLKTDYKNDTKKKILSNKKLSKEGKITMFNNLVQKNLIKNMSGQPMSEDTPENIKTNYDVIDEEVQSVKNEYDEFQDKNTYDWIKEESLTPFSADLRRFSSMLNKTLKNYNQSNNYTPRNISMNEPNNDLSDFTLRDNLLNNLRYSIKDPSDFSLRNISLNDSNHLINENQSIFQRPTQRQQGLNDQYQTKPIEK
ncbi:unnamed protein product [Brachionus calyciflorus]|uniref:Uncharacterized protein n=1 Tax=Brachionus calyciflorus TaxID=104777 RepID=A0A814PIE1_9BILA|nr:unnamed protein product [Brachionus calyciflorus]